MSLIKYNNNLPTDLFRFFDDSFTRKAHQQATKRLPAVNIAESDNSFTLEVLAPGRLKDNFKVELNDELLTISYEAEEAEAPKLVRREFTIGNFKRTFKLDAKVINGEAIGASYENGILTLSLPKLENAVAKGPQLIEIA